MKDSSVLKCGSVSQPMRAPEKQITQKRKTARQVPLNWKDSFRKVNHLKKTWIKSWLSQRNSSSPGYNCGCLKRFRGGLLKISDHGSSDGFILLPVVRNRNNFRPTLMELPKKGQQPATVVFPVKVRCSLEIVLAHLAGDRRPKRIPVRGKVYRVSLPDAKSQESQTGITTLSQAVWNSMLGVKRFVAALVHRSRRRWITYLKCSANG